MLTMCELVCMLDLNITFKKKEEDEGEKEEEEEIGIGQEEEEITTLQSSKCEINLPSHQQPIKTPAAIHPCQHLATRDLDFAHLKREMVSLGC